MTDGQRLGRQLLNLCIGDSLIHNSQTVERSGNSTFGIWQHGQRALIGGRQCRPSRAAAQTVLFLTGERIDAACNDCGCAVDMNSTYCPACRNARQLGYHRDYAERVKGRSA